MSIRLAVFQRASRPLDGLCAQLRCAGYDVFERDAPSAAAALAADGGIDVLVIDAAARGAETLLDEIRARPGTVGLPVMLIAAEASTALTCESWRGSVDDIVLLPIERHELRARIRNLARLASMAGELQRRRHALRDFGVEVATDPAPARSSERTRMLLVGPAGGSHAELLEALGGAVTATYAATEEAALDHLGRSEVDLVIIAATMPGAEIGTLCRAIRTTAACKDLPILMLAGQARSRSLGSLLDRGEAELLELPSHPAVVRRRVHLLARQRRLRCLLRGLLDRGRVPVIDGLTGLCGHGFFHHYLEQVMADSRERGLPLSLVGCRIAKLDFVNDHFGYPTGDRVLQDAAVALQGSCRAQDLVARVHGRGFCILLNDTTEPEARAVLERIAADLEALAQRMIGQPSDRLGVALGLTELAKGDNAQGFAHRAFQQAPSIVLSRAS